MIGVPAKYYPPLEVFEKNLMISILNECGLILERRRLRDEKQKIALETQRERLRSTCCERFPMICAHRLPASAEMQAF